MHYVSKLFFKFSLFSIIIIMKWDWIGFNCLYFMLLLYTCLKKNSSWKNSIIKYAYSTNFITIWEYLAFVVIAVYLPSLQFPFSLLYSTLKFFIFYYYCYFYLLSLFVILVLFALPLWSGRFPASNTFSMSSPFPQTV